jgi:hypothetical protein
MTTLESATGFSYEDLSCPKCGGTKPTCCSCPPEDHLKPKPHTPEELKALPYEAIEAVAREMKVMADSFVFLSACLPDKAAGAKGQLKRCAEMLHRRADRIHYDSCVHVWKGHTNPGTPDSPPEHFEFCDLCGADKQEDLEVVA